MVKLQPKYHLLIPVSLQPILDEFEKSPPDISGFAVERLSYLVSLILTHKQKDHQFSYSILNMEYLTNIVPRAGEYMKFLNENGIVEWKNYSAGRNSRLYRMIKEYQGPAVFRTMTDQNLVRRIQENSKSLKYQNSKKYPHLNKFVHMIKVYSEGAYRTIDATYNHMLNSEIPEIKNKAENHRTFSIGEIQKIIQGQIYIKVNKTNFRYDTNYTRLPSELVKHLHINGIQLKEMDIANSQPFFALGLFNPTPEIQKIMGQSLFMYTKSLKLDDKEDVKMYTSHVSTGKFYDYFEGECKNIGLCFRDRRDFKDHLFTVFFGESKALAYSKTVKLFSTIFPNVWWMFCIIKTARYNRLAILLQHIESHTMLNCVSQKIFSMYPSIPFLTKHDSILLPGNLTNQLTEEIEKLILSTIQEVVGHKPNLKRK